MKPTNMIRFSPTIAAGERAATREKEARLAGEEGLIEEDNLVLIMTERMTKRQRQRNLFLIKCREFEKKSSLEPTRARLS